MLFCKQSKYLWRNGLFPLAFLAGWMMTYINMQTDIMNTPKKMLGIFTNGYRFTESVVFFFSPQLYINATLTCLNGEKNGEKEKYWSLKCSLHWSQATTDYCLWRMISFLPPKEYIIRSVCRDTCFLWTSIYTSWFISLRLISINYQVGVRQ